MSLFKLRLWGALQLEIMPPKKVKNTQMSAVICLVCEKKIVDASANTTGEDSIKCEGLCNAWLHRKCASMSKTTFEAAQLSSDPFLCPHCRHDAQQDEIRSLKESVSHLLSRVAELESRLGLSHQNISGGSTVDTSVSDVSASTGVRSHLLAADAVVGDHRSSPAEVSTLQNERRFNIVISGVEECSKGTSRKDRLKHDFNEITTLITNLDSQIESSTVRDHLRLGKFDPKSKRPRRILVKLTRTSEVSSILSKSGSVRAPLRIEPDLSPQDRKMKAALMKERWTLLQSGLNRKDIKVRGSRLLVRNKVYAQFRSGAVVRVEQVALGDQAGLGPALVDTASRKVTEASSSELADSPACSFLIQNHP